MVYRTIYADPPWNERGGGRIKRGANRHYPLMSTEDIIRLGFSLRSFIADDGCHLYLWVTNNHLPDGLEVMKQWGFRYITMLTWVKTGKRIGIGQYFRGMTEHLLFGVLGKLPFKYSEGKRIQGKTVIYAPRGRHSEKPAKAREVIERMSYEPRLELFARKKTPGWDVWGNEVESDITLTTDVFAPCSLYRRYWLFLPSMKDGVLFWKGGLDDLAGTYNKLSEARRALFSAQGNSFFHSPLHHSIYDRETKQHRYIRR